MPPISLLRIAQYSRLALPQVVQIPKQYQECIRSYGSHLSRSPFLDAGSNSRRRDHRWVHLSEEIQEALDCRRPIVALESTIITHGMPHPANLETALAVEQQVRDNGAIPATVAILDGRLCVGLTESQLQTLATQATTSTNVQKVSRRDLPVMLGSKGSLGGTTVSATMLAAYWSGIAIFATGGVGGVHRGGQNTMDVSADLTELGRTPVCVVSAGIKSLLDVRRSLEYLETRGVCVAGYGVDEFPAFFTRRSGVPCPARINSVQDAARLVDVMIRSQMESGVLIAVPIPEKFEAIGSRIEAAIQQAITESMEKGIEGPAVTPFILERVNELTGGDSLLANIELVKNNAAVAGQLATAYTELCNSTSGDILFPGSPESRLISPAYETKGVNTFSSNSVIVIGGSSVDQVCCVVEPEVNNVAELVPMSYKGTIGQSCGGVGHNVAEALARMGGVGGTTKFLTAVSDDLGSSFLRSASGQLDWSHARVLPRGSGMRTASYTATLNTSGNLLFGIGDMEIHDAIDSGYIEGKLMGEGLLTGEINEKVESVHATKDPIVPVPSSKCILVCADGNIPLESLATVVRLTRVHSVPLWYEPTDIMKATKILAAINLYRDQVHSEPTLPLASLSKCLQYISPNFSEYCNLYTALTGDELRIKDTPSSNLNGFLDALYESVRRVQAKGIANWIVKLGEHGLIIVTPDYSSWFESAVKPNNPDTKIVSVSGAGDSLAGCMIHLRFVCNLDWRLSALGGLKAAQLSISVLQTVSDRLKAGDFHPSLLEKWGRDLQMRKFH